MNKEKLNQMLQTVMDEAVARQEVAGVNLLVLRSGRELVYAQSGYADIERKVPMQRDTIFRLYSMSKPVTAAAVMILMERGVIDLGDRVENYLPGFHEQVVASGGSTVPARRPTTIADLLSMASGLLYPGSGRAGEASKAVFDEMIDRMDGPSPMTTVELANRLGKEPLAFHPGEHFQYGTSADILGAIVEVASGMSFGEFLQKEIFGPLHMQDTGFYIPAEKQARKARTYEHAADGALVEFPSRHLGISYRIDRAPAFESGGAGLVSTLPDYGRFASMLLSGGKLQDASVLLPATVDYMTKGTLLPWQQQDLWRDWNGLTGYSYGNLMRVMKAPGMAVMLTTMGEYGWDGWLGTYFSNHPNENLTFLMGVQLRDAGTFDLTRKLRNLVLSNLL